MRSTAKLAFDMLEDELEVMSFDETFEIVGGVMITYAIYTTTHYVTTQFADPHYTTTKTPKITIGPLTTSGISQGMSLGFNGSGIFNANGGAVQSLNMQSNGNIGFQQNANGGWSAAANFGVISRLGYSNPQGNVSMYIGGQLVGVFSMSDTSGQYPNGTISQPGETNIGGSFNLPASYNGSQPVTFSVSIGATNDSGVGNQYVSESGNATLSI